jgi:phenylalanyl-tRNA synthetase beta chain
MKISYNWLHTLIDTGKTPGDLAQIMTGTGLEVESIENTESVKGGLKGLVIGEVLSCEKHPEADRLTLTRVDVGNGSPLSIVCGAANVAAGQKVVVATVGTTLYPAKGEPFTIKKSKIRGAVSEGMICAEDEIGLGEDHAGIMVLPAAAKTGTPASKFFSIENDSVFEIGLTPNRGDATSHYGVARDIAAALNSAEHSHAYMAKLPDAHPQPENGDTIKVKIIDRAGCKRYSCLAVHGIRVEPAPEWVQARLRSVGMRPVNNIVDITNYVLMELGQPLHAFDLEKIKDHKIVVRQAYSEEKLVTLDGVERKLSEHDLVIADSESPMCIAGVLGGASSGVTTSTTSVLLESAYFDANYVRGGARRHGIHSDAAFRFERGTDPEMTVTALLRAAKLIADVQSDARFELYDDYVVKLEPHKVAFSYTNCTDLIGKDIDRHHIKNILLNLGMTIDSEGTDGLLLYVPRYRGDVTREADLIEEVLRIYGHNNIEPAKLISYTAPPVKYDSNYDFEQKIGRILEHSGFNEIMTLSLTKEGGSNNPSVVRLANPLSADHTVMRSDLLETGLESIAHNINRKNADLKLFEFGRGYALAEGGAFGETPYLGIFVTGEAFRQNPYGVKKKADFAVLKSVVDDVLARCGISGHVARESTHDGLEYGLSYILNKQTLAEFGAVKSGILDRTGISQPVYFAQLRVSEIRAAAATHVVTYNEVPKFPSVRRDLALLIDKTVPYGEIESLAYATERKLLQEVNLFDIYEDQKLGNRKSLAVSFMLLSEQATLTDKQIDSVMEKLLTAFREKLGAELRQ